jgi:hypothetical protein
MTTRRQIRHAPEKSTRRTDVLMVIATGLAAIVAVGSAVAAFRQEKATFTTNLYSKQVDSLSSILNELVRLGGKLNSLDDLENPLSVDLSSPKIKELSELNEKKHYEKQYAKLVLTGTLAIMPDHVLGEVAEAFEDSLEAIKLLPTAFGPNSTVELEYLKMAQSEEPGDRMISVPTCRGVAFGSLKMMAGNGGADPAHCTRRGEPMRSKAEVIYQATLVVPPGSASTRGRLNQ